MDIELQNKYLSIIEEDFTGIKNMLDHIREQITEYPVYVQLAFIQPIKSMVFEAWLDALDKNNTNNSIIMEEYIKQQTALIKLYKAYVKLLGEEINDLVGIASYTGWQSRHVEEGHTLRQQIATITKQLNKINVTTQKG